ncbi:hypothetical protein ACS0TY_011520 [Phlomoides rotata]
MAKGTRGRRGIASRQCRPSPYPLPSYKEEGGMQQTICSKVIKKDWEDATCSVCMECPHNAVLLLCSSHEKGCRPYMCGTSFRYSNCLDQYKKAYTKSTSSQSRPVHDSLDTQVIGPFSGQKCEAVELACPLCRGQVKGWTIVEAAREHLNATKRNCMQDNCAFIGTYKELRKHVKAEHPSARPREVDPTLEQKWRRLEHEREREDVMSTIRSSMPGAVFFGDYVIDRSRYDFDSDEEEEEEGFDVDVMERNEGTGVGIDRNLMSVFLFLQAFGSAGNAGPNRGIRRHDRDSNIALDRGAMRLHHDSSMDGLAFSDQDSDEDEDDIENGGRLHGQGRVLSGRSGRRRRHREANGERA